MLYNKCPDLQINKLSEGHNNDNYEQLTCIIYMYNVKYVFRKQHESFIGQSLK